MKFQDGGIWSRKCFNGFDRHPGDVLSWHNENRLVLLRCNVLIFKAAVRYRWRIYVVWRTWVNLNWTVWCNTWSWNDIKILRQRKVISVIKEYLIFLQDFKFFNGSEMNCPYSGWRFWWSRYNLFFTFIKVCNAVTQSPPFFFDFLCPQLISSSKRMWWSSGR